MSQFFRSLYGTPLARSANRCMGIRFGSSSATSVSITPAAGFLLHQHNISADHVNKIPASGPGNRLLKADVLAYVGSLNADYIKAQNDRIGGLAKLDLTNIQLREPPAPSASAESAAPKSTTVPKNVAQPVIVAVDVSLKAVNRYLEEHSLTAESALSTDQVLSQAFKAANAHIAHLQNRAYQTQPGASAEDIFFAELRRDIDRSQGKFDLSPFTPTVAPQQKKQQKPAKLLPQHDVDFFAYLSGAAKPSAKPSATPPSSSSDNERVAISINTLPVRKDNAAKFLAKVKDVLENNPGSLASNWQ